ncbi:hypothetical protein BJ742DRAFT_244181 [Cladochytrium replicatum]|nr:hypothetical protein BJ742DRAFT_244181 [Cladochytrium replicatum]
MVELDIDVEILCWVSAVTAVCSGVAFASGLFWCVANFTKSGRTWRSWTRFQRLSYLSCVFGIPAMLASVVEIVLEMYFEPERLSKPAGAQPFETSGGAALVLISLSSTVGNILIPITVFCYFLVLMERFNAFQFLWPRKYFKIVHSSVLVLGVLLFFAMEAPNILVNIIPPSSLLTRIAFILSTLLLIVSTIIEWTLSIALCRSFFSNTGLTPPARQHLSLNTFRSEFEGSDAPPTSPTLCSSNASFQSNPTTSKSPTPLVQHRSVGSSSNRQSRNMSEANSHTGGSGASFITVMGDVERRRSILLFAGFVLTDLIGYMVYILGFLPDSRKLARPLSVRIFPVLFLLAVSRADVNHF